jgi:hypothetical protein
MSKSPSQPEALQQHRDSPNSGTSLPTAVSTDDGAALGATDNRTAITDQAVAKVQAGPDGVEVSLPPASTEAILVVYNKENVQVYQASEKGPNGNDMGSPVISDCRRVEASGPNSLKPVVTEMARATEELNTSEECSYVVLGSNVGSQLAWGKPLVSLETAALRLADPPLVAVVDLARQISDEPDSDNGNELDKFRAFFPAALPAVADSVPGTSNLVGVNGNGPFAGRSINTLSGSTIYYTEKAPVKVGVGSADVVVLVPADKRLKPRAKFFVLTD